MQAVTEGFNVVLVGAWNVSIFSPNWIGQNLTEAKDVGMEMAVNDPSQPLRFSFDDVFLLVHPSRVVIHPRFMKESLLPRLQNVADKILELLPHTPLQAVGINFRFQEANPPEILTRAFEPGDTDHLSDAGAIVKETTVSRQISFRSHVVNLGLQLSNAGTATIDFNYHQDAKNSDEARGYLKQNLLQLRDEAVDLLKDAYEIESLEMGRGQ